MPEKQFLENTEKVMPWAEWLGSRECPEFLEGCAGKIRTSASNRGLVISKESLETGALWEFLASRPDVAEKVFLALGSNNPTKARQLLANYYLLQLIDLRRTRQDSAYHSLYRKTRILLSKHSNFTCVSDRKGTYYAHGQVDANSPIIRDFSTREINYSFLPDPHENPGCSQAQYIISGAVVFYARVCEHLSKSGLIPVRELTAYLMTRPRLNKDILKILRISDLEGDGKREGHVSTMDSFPSENTPCPHLSGIVESALPYIARAMVEAWTDGMAQAFYLHTGRELDLVKIAGIMGYKGASGVKYQLGLVHESIRRSSAAWPLLSPPDLDNTMFSRFLEHVLIFCKQRTTSRNTDQQSEKLISP